MKQEAEVSNADLHLLQSVLEGAPEVWVLPVGLVHGCMHGGTHA